MGQTCSTQCTSVHAKVVMFGLNLGGKTTILKRLVGGAFIPKYEPTIGFNFEKLKYGEIQYDVWDVGGEAAVRQFWEHYIEGVAGVLYVVDSTDHSRMELAAQELSALLSLEELRTAVFLILAHKQDLHDAIEPSALPELLGLSNTTEPMWGVQGTDAITGNGLNLALDWMTDALLKKDKLRCFNWCRIC